MMRADGVVLGVDLATASARCVAVDSATGRVLSTALDTLSAPRSGDGDREPGAVRQRPDYGVVARMLVGRVAAGLSAAARQRVTAVAVSATSGTVVPVDRDGLPVGDARTYRDVAKMRYAGRSLMPEPAMPAMLRRVRLLAEEFPQAYFATAADAASAALAGRSVAGDTSHWRKAGIVDNANGASANFDSESLIACGLHRESLPELVEPGSILATLDRALATDCGLPADVLVIAGMTDGCTAQIAAGAVDEGDTLGVLGTTLVLKSVARQSVTTMDGAVYSHRSPDGMYWPGGASNTGGGVLATIADVARFGEFDAAALRRGPASVVRYPLAHPGERFPVNDAELRDLCSGTPNDEVDMYRAALDGVALVEHYALERLRAEGVCVRRHFLAGGAARSGPWSAIRAAIVGAADGPSQELPVVRAPASGSSFGAAVLAAAAARAASSHGDARDYFTTTVNTMVAMPTEVEPDARTVSAAPRLRAAFRAMLVDAGVAVAA